MKKNTIVVITVLMSISLFGICGLEWYWINKAISEKAEEFDRAVQRGMYSAVNQLKESEIENVFIKRLLASGGSLTVGGTQIDENYHTDIEIIESAYNGEVVKKTITSTHSTTIETVDEYHMIHSITDDNQSFIFETPVLADANSHIDDLLSLDADAAKQIVHVIADIIRTEEIGSNRYRRSVQNRIGKTNLDSLLSNTFLQEGIDVPFSFAVYQEENDTLHADYANVELAEAMLLDFSVPLFVDFPEETLLKVGFPSKDIFVLKSLGGVLIMVLLFSLLMLATFAKTLHAILKQKRLAEVKSDFINNMTHEFKTPLATIRLAVDSINHPRVKSDPDQITRFTGIIAEESKRLNGHVEKILQLAKMEKGDLIVKCVPTDFAKLVSDAIASMELRVSARAGSLTFENNADINKVEVDPNHIYNAMVNLIDNALKYSEDKPDIKVKLVEQSDFLILTVQDHGIGMSHDVQKKAFDPFFRAQSGDVHNVKGFGVGLSYVREVVQLHHGTIILKSGLGKGSIVGFKIPLNG